MTTDPPAPEPAGTSRRWSDLLRVMTARPRRAGLGEHMRTLSIGGRIVRVAVREGNPDWPPLLLCNGIGASLELFQPFVDALDPQRPVIRFDMPGIGGSPAPVVPYHLVTLPSLLTGLLDQLGYEQADVLGISWGGGLAQQFAASCPDRVRRLVLVATGPGALMVPGHPRVLLRMLTPRRHRDPGHAARIAGELYGGSVRDDPALARDLLHATTPPGSVHGLLLPAAIQHRLDQPAAAAEAAAAHPDPGRRRRPDHPADQRADHALADTAQRAAHLSRRPPRAGRGRRTHGSDRGGVPRRRKEPMMTQVASEHLGESLGTDFFSVREQFTDEQWEHFITVRRFVDEEVVPVVGPYWERAEICWPLVKRLPELGIVGEDIKGYGCAGMSPMACGLVTMELHRGDGSLGVFLGVHAGLAMLSIAMCGSEEQKARWLPDMAQMNKLGAFALTEPEHGSDSVALETSARPDGDGWVLNGRKRWIGLGSVADLVVVWARNTEDGQVNGFVVEKGSPGYQARVIEGKVSLRSVWQAEITLENVRVPAENRLPGARSFKDTTRVLATTRSTCAWGALGHATAAYDAALRYAQERRQFGEPLASFQIIQQRLVSMLADLTAMQLYCLQIGRLAEAGLTPTVAGLAKMHNTRKARAITAEARDMLGGNGILLDYQVMRHMVDMEAIHTFEGTETMQTLIVGRAITGIGAFT